MSKENIGNSQKGNKESSVKHLYENRNMAFKRRSFKKNGKNVETIIRQM